MRLTGGDDHLFKALVHRCGNELISQVAGSEGGHGVRIHFALDCYFHPVILDGFTVTFDHLTHCLARVDSVIHQCSRNRRNYIILCPTSTPFFS